MLKLVALWSPPKPEDRAAFEAAYLDVHAPLARALPNLAGLDTILVADGLEGAVPDFHRIAVMIWPDQAAFDRDEKTPEWTALRANAGEMLERFGVTLTSSIGQDG
ncbi:MAG: EthD family reductase [Sandarakinorhabdus sp.]|nr:EthD family reductase [Sandarakinorhabdus sp.]